MWLTTYLYSGIFETDRVSCHAVIMKVSTKKRKVLNCIELILLYQNRHFSISSPSLYCTAEATKLFFKLVFNEQCTLEKV